MLVCTTPSSEGSCDDGGCSFILNRTLCDSFCLPEVETGILSASILLYSHVSFVSIHSVYILDPQNNDYYTFLLLKTVMVSVSLYHSFI